MNSWQDFINICRDKKLILYGLGTLLNYFFIRCGDSVKISAAVDNDVSKQGHLLSDFFDVDDNIIINSKDSLSNFDPDNVVFLVSSFRYFDEIAADLKNSGFKFIFSTQFLESDYRNEIGSSFDSDDNYMNEFAKICTDKFPVQKNKIIFLSMDRYPEHGKYITQKLLEKNSDLDIVWSGNSDSIDIPAGVRWINEGKFKSFIYEIETAKILIHSTAIRSTFQIKREEQIYIQIKHWGSLTLKKFFLDEFDCVEKDLWLKTGLLFDYLISGSSLDESSCRSGFNFKGKFFRAGSPRSDILFNPDFPKSKIFQKFNLNSHSKILLFAPTWRGLSDKFLHGIDLDFYLIKSSLEKKFGGDWFIFLRFHPSVKINSNFNSYPDFVFNVSNYQDSQELIAASDILISDYSSIIFEPAYVFKPVFLCAPDKDFYLNNERQLLFNYDSLPFPVSSDNLELSNQILNFNQVLYRDNLQKFFEFYGVNEDGHASERAADFILDLLR